MKKIVLLFVLLCATVSFSQERTFEKEVIKISKKIEQITKSEKAALKEKVVKIEAQLTAKEISKETALKLKKEAAEFHASNIENLVSAQEKKLQQLVQDKTNGKIARSKKNFEEEGRENSFTIGKRRFRINVSNNDDRDPWKWNKKRSKRKYSRRTTSQFVFAMGVNNLLENNSFSSLDNSNYKFWQSHFYELGFSFKTRFTKEASKLYFKYGLSFSWNNLRLKDNQYHVVNGNSTNIMNHTEALSESRLRNAYMTFPMHLELDFSENRKYDDGRTRDRTHQAVRFGLGGFFGFKLGTKQYLEYSDTTGTDIIELQKDDFNTKTFVYGLSTYLAYESYGLYVKYDLSPLFKNTESRNISLGLRFDIN